MGGSVVKPTMNPRFAKWDGNYVVTAVSSGGMRAPAEAILSIREFACCPEDGIALIAEVASMNPLGLEIRLGELGN